MKPSSILSVLFTFTILHLSKAGPLRLQKRAVFYIANETACVVDNKVYNNGQQIPTDDPCESCKCRPPGFACVLVDCKVKPGCRAVRRDGQCCPEYICGCEHNGRMYLDGEEIRDPKNPCYECHCQGSSIACAFVDCYFRDDCEALYMPGMCCPEYRNCTRDLPEGNSFFGGNILPSANLLPSLNDESVISGESLSTQKQESSERPADPTQPPTPSSSNAEIVPTESKESAEIVSTESKESDEIQNKPQTTDPAISAIEDSDASIEESDSEEKKINFENNKDLTEDEGDDKVKAEESSEEMKTLFNSDTEINKEDSADLTEIKINPTESSLVDTKDEKLQATAANAILEDENEAEVTEKSRDESGITETPDKEKQVKNSAAENGKSLKLSDDQTEEPGKKEEIEEDISEKAEETSKIDVDSKTDTSSQMPLVSEESSTAESESESKESELESKESEPESKESEPESKESEPESKESELESKESESASTEIVPEEIQLDPKESNVNSNEKIKSESAETVTIVVHVREKTQLTTEKDLVTETILPESATSVTQESLLKSSELKDPKNSDESTEAEAVSTAKNFEIFPSTTEISKDESTNSSSSTDQELEGKTKVTTLKEEVTTYDTKNEEPAITTTSATDDTEISKEARDNEEAIDEPKKEEPTITIIRIDPNSPIKIEIITDTLTTAKTEEPPSKDLENKEVTEETKTDDDSEIKAESQQENVTEISSEVREDPEKETVTEKLEETKSKPLEKVEESTSTEKVQESTSIEKVQEPTSTEKIQDLKSAEKVQEPASTEKVQDPTSTEKVQEPTSTEKVQEPASTEKVQELTSTEKTEKIAESISTEKVEVETSENNAKTEEQAQKAEVLKTTTERAESAGTERTKFEDLTSITSQVIED